MGVGDWLQLAVAAGGGLGSGWLLRHQSKAQARKANAESETLDWGRFTKEIARLDRKIADLGKENERQAGEIEALKADRDKRERASDKRERENQFLRGKVQKLEDRLKLLEGLFAKFSVDPRLPPELAVLIEQLNHVPGLSDEEGR